MEFVMPILEGAWRYVLTLRISDYLDIALMAYAIYWLLKLVGTSKVESVGKVILLFLLALMLSDAFSLNGIYFLLSHILSRGALALIQSLCPHAAGLRDRECHCADGARLHGNVQNAHGRSHRLRA